MSKKDKALLIITGVVTGLAVGFFGGGGGMIVVPMLTIIIGLVEKKAHATAIAVILPSSIVSGIIQIVNGNYNLEVGLPVGIGVFLGGIIGAILLKFIKNKVLVKLFAIVMVVAGVKLLFF